MSKLSVGALPAREKKLSYFLKRLSGALCDARRLVGIAAGGYALYRAWAMRWLADDAFISFRYAKNLVQGLGLVYNAGERVEGYTNFLWTLLLSPAFFWGPLSIGFLSEVLGLSFYAGSLFLLYRFSEKQRHLPVAFLGFAFFFHGQVYATSGLETSFYTFFVIWIATRLFLVPGPSFLDYFLAGIAALIRPDGLLLFFCISLQDILTNLRLSTRALSYKKSIWKRLAARMKPLLFRQAGFLLVFLPFLVWRCLYYGDFFPNTYYAKSANQSYWTQGLVYAWLFFSSYYVFAIALLFVFAILGTKVFRKALFAWKAKDFFVFPRTAYQAAWGLFLLIHFLYYIKIGGGFMFARFFLPAIPVLLILLEICWSDGPIRKGLPNTTESPQQTGLFLQGLFRSGTADTTGIWHRGYFPSMLFGMFVLGLLLRYDPYRGRPLPIRHGISEEHKFYSPAGMADLKRRALALRPFFRHARIAIGGAQAALAFYLDPPFVLESATGLTDAFLARLPLQKRGRIGHEKRAPLWYLRKRRVHLQLFAPSAETRRPYNRFVMPGFASGDMRIIVYEREVMANFSHKAGFQFVDFPAYLDDYIKNRLSKKEASELQADYQEFCGYYFRWNSDLQREAAFRDALRALFPKNKKVFVCQKSPK